MLAWDAKELLRDEHARPIARTDIEGKKVEVYRYKNPKRPEWPEAEGISSAIRHFVAGCFLLNHSLSNTSALPAVQLSASSQKPSI